MTEPRPQENAPPRVAAVIVAAGRGARAGGPQPKQFQTLAGQTLLRRTVKMFVDDDAIEDTVVVVAEDRIDQADRELSGLGAAALVPGGTDRQGSVLNGLEAIAERDTRLDRATDIVLIHDAARPFVSPDIIASAIGAAITADGAVPLLPVVDSLRRVNAEGGVADGPDRTDLGRAQTPQAFRFNRILAAHRAAKGGNASDDVQIALDAGLSVVPIPGAEDNFKLTTPADFERAERMLDRKSLVRTGIGFDVHRFAPGTRVRLCGVDVPHDRALEGHSDADVGLHAITDAILGAIGDGDIGSHFPPSDPTWRGADSAAFLAHAAALVAKRDGAISSIDVTLICEAPKIGPYRERMRARIAEILGLGGDRVSVKATTTEGLGFTGRREGIAAQAIATVTVRGD